MKRITILIFIITAAIMNAGEWKSELELNAFVFRGEASQETKEILKAPGYEDKYSKTEISKSSIGAGIGIGTDILFSNTALDCLKYGLGIGVKKYMAEKEFDFLSVPVYLKIKSGIFKGNVNPYLEGKLGLIYVHKDEGNGYTEKAFIENIYYSFGAGVEISDFVISLGYSEYDLAKEKSTEEGALIRTEDSKYVKGISEERNRLYIKEFDLRVGLKLEFGK